MIVYRIAEDERDDRVAQLFADAPLLVFQFGLLLSSPDARSGRLDRSPPVAMYKAPSILPDSRRLQWVVLSNEALAARSPARCWEVRNSPLGESSFALLTLGRSIASETHTSIATSDTVYISLDRAGNHFA